MGATEEASCCHKDQMENKKQEHCGSVNKGADLNLYNRVSMLSPKEAACVANDACEYKANKPFGACVFSAAVAGLFISLAFAFYITVTLGASSAPYGLVKLIGGCCFSLGLILVVVCGNDLFTSTILTIVPKVEKRISWATMFKSWVLVYFGNFVGALVFVAIIWFAGQHMVANGQWGLSVLNVADHKLHHTFTEAVFLGLMANLMVCLAAWMSYAGTSLLDKMMVMILPVAFFVASGFEHSIANMFMIPMGLVIKNAASPEFWEAAGSSAAQFPQLTVEHFLVKNLLPVTIGNILGGLMVGLSFWWLNLRNAKH